MAGDSPGIIRATDISGSLDAKNIVMGVLKGALELTDLLPLCGKASVPELTATIPVMTIEAGMEDLEEWEEREIEGAEFTNVDFALKKDRVKIARSDEAMYKSKAGDPLALQKGAASLRLAQILNKKIVAALDTTPSSVTGSDWKTQSNNPISDIGQALAKIKPYKGDFILMDSTAWAAYTSNVYTAAVTGIRPNLAVGPGAISRVPGYDLDIFVSDEVQDGYAYVGARNAPAAVVGNGPVKVRTKDVMSGGDVYQIDVFRQVKAPIMFDADSSNNACCKMTGLAV